MEATVQILQRSDFDELIQALRKVGFCVVGPTERNGVIVIDEISSDRDLPAGKTDEQKRGEYRLKGRDDDALFGYVNGPQSWKSYLHPPKVRMWRATKQNGRFTIEKPDAVPPQQMAFLGVRSCDLSAIMIQDHIFMSGAYVDSQYKARRENSFIIALNCTSAGENCFCGSMESGPEMKSIYDLCLTEVIDDEDHYFLINIGTPSGEELLGKLPTSAANEEQMAMLERLQKRCDETISRKVQNEGLKQLLKSNYDHPIWSEIAQRCLSCGNCTMVCPTCFCTTVEDTTDLSGHEAVRWQTWDTCFTEEFSYIHGGSVRASTAARYRQWLIHKFATWNDQFGMSGCVGCGRCITWCPVGIDVTEELTKLKTPRAAVSH